MSWILGIGALAVIFYLVRRNLKRQEDQKSLRIFSVFFVFSSVVCLLSIGKTEFFQIGNYFSYLVAAVKKIL